MGIIFNTAKNISLKIDFIKNDNLDYDINRNDRENWIPFDLKFCSKEEEYNYSANSGCSMSLYEVKTLIKEIQKIVRIKNENNSVERFEFGTIDRYFLMDFYETYEDGEVNIDLWFIIAKLSNGKLFGYDKGFRFCVQVQVLDVFVEDLRKQLELILNIKI